MRHRLLSVLLLPLVLLVALAAAGPAVAADSSTATARLSGAEEVPAASTRARGMAVFRLDRDGEALHYRLNVVNIENVSMAHIHLAPAGQNGGVVAWLYPSAPPPQLLPGRSSGLLASGTLTEANLVGALAGMTIEDLYAQISADNAYVNVHTSQFPGGEIRGQIHALRP